MTYPFSPEWKLFHFFGAMSRVTTMKVIRLMTCLLLGSAALIASANPEGEARYRQGVMTSVGGHMTAISLIMRRGIHRDSLKFHADALAALAKKSQSIYPEGSDVGRSEALPAIWEKPDAFRKATQRFIDASEAFAEAADSGDQGAVGQALRGLGGSCKGCHDDFRAKS